MPRSPRSLKRIFGVILLSVLSCIWFASLMLLAAQPVSRGRSIGASERLTFTVERGWIGVGRFWQPRPAPAEKSQRITSRTQWLGIVQVQTERVTLKTQPATELAHWTIVSVHALRLVLFTAPLLIVLWGLWLKHRIKRTSDGGGVPVATAGHNNAGQH